MFQKSTFILSVIALAGIGSAQAAPIYTEDFTGQEGKGAVGNGTASPTVDTTGVDWTIDVSGATLTDSGDTFWIDEDATGSGKLEGVDLDGTAVWMSPTIDISSVGSVQASMQLGYFGTFEASDFLTVSVSVDGTETVSYNDASPNNDGVTFLTHTTDELSGSSLQIIVRMQNNAGNEFMWLDNVTVDAVPEPGSMSLLAIGVGCFMARRRR